MRNLLSLAGAALAASLLMPTTATTVEAQERIQTTTDTTLRAGPGTEFERIRVVPEGQSVTLHGCTPEYRWCNVTWRGDRGWVSGRNVAALGPAGREQPILEFGLGLGLPTITFRPGEGPRIEAPRAPIVDAPREPVTDVRGITVSDLNMRRGPGTRYGRVATIPEDSVIRIHDCAAGWCNVTWAGRTGYVSERFVEFEGARG